MHRQILKVQIAALAAVGSAGCASNQAQHPEPSLTPKVAISTPSKVRFPKPSHVRGIYLTAWSAGSKKKLDKVLQMIEKTEINSLVIDIRDAGIVYVANNIELATKSGATRKAIYNLAKVLDKLEAKGVYPIARIACFRDDFVPRKFPERGVQLADGKLWKDRSGHTWLDPYNTKNWDYIGEVVKVALDAGFPEIQLDYVRFPSEGKSSSMRFPAKKSYQNPKAVPTQVVVAAAEAIKKPVTERKATLSADIFGIVSSGGGDQGIGQELRTIVSPFDVVSPMVYPSHFAKGEYGISEPSQAPYNILKKSLRDYARKLPGVAIRPWLQDFSLGGITYGKDQVRSQIKACYELGYRDFLLWNPRNEYTMSAVVDTTALMPKEPAKKVP